MRSMDGLVGRGVGGGSLCVPSKIVSKIMFLYFFRNSCYDSLQLLKEDYDLTLRWREAKKHLQHLDSLAFKLPQNFSQTTQKEL